MNIIPMLSLAVFVSTALTATGTARVLYVEDETAHQEEVKVKNNGPSLSIENQIKRLQKRVQNRFGVLPSEYNAKRALLTRRALFGHTTNVAFSGLTDMHAAPWTVSLSQHPDWVVFDAARMTFGIDEALVLASLDAEYPMGMQKASHAEVLSTYDDKGVLHASLSGTPRDGYILDTEIAARAVAEAFAAQKDSITLNLTFEKGTITKDGQKLTLLGTGKSEYASSPAGRKSNVRKSINERLNTAIAPKGEVFSFNETLGGPVTYSNGWLDSLIIVNGKDLEPAAGGGICQGATTLYRGVMLAGLPVIARKPHSLYVTYYKKFGLGIDATIFPKKQDFTFLNDTPGDIVILAHTNDKHEAFVSLYGIDDGRTVEMEGPYLAATAPEWIKVNGRPVSGREVVWNQKITFGDGTVKNNLIVSNYTGLPSNSLAKEFPQSVGNANFYDPVALPSTVVAENL